MIHLKINSPKLRQRIIKYKTTKETHSKSQANMTSPIQMDYILFSINRLVIIQIHKSNFVKVLLLLSFLIIIFPFTCNH